MGGHHPLVNRPAPARLAVVGPPFLPIRGRKLGRARARAGFTILETTIASALLAVFLTSLFALNSTVIRMLRSANEAAYASQELQCRVEQIRMTSWVQVTNPATVRTLFARPTDATLDLLDLTEALLVRPYSYDLPAQSPAFKFQRAPDGTVTPATDGPAATGVDLSDPGVAMIRLDFSVTWRSWGGRMRSRALTTVVSRMGVSK